MTEPEFDPRWEWLDVTTYGDRERRYIKGRCNHLEAVPVISVTGEHVAHLCLVCDAQLPPGGQP
jgi:hypothetical protein